MKSNIEAFQLEDFDINTLSNFHAELESKAYLACRFKLNNKNIIYRKSKVTPKKMGQFVTCWKRNSLGKTEPIQEIDQFAYLIVNLNTSSDRGYFCFPKKTLLEKGILKTSKTKGKLGFRVYPPWDNPKSKQALSSQQWQKNHFYSNHNALLIKTLQNHK